MEYLYICQDKDRNTYNKVTGKFIHLNFAQGLPIEWIIKKVVHCYDGSTKEHKVFDGRIPTNEFGKELIKNTLL